MLSSWECKNDLTLDDSSTLANVQARIYLLHCENRECFTTSYDTKSDSSSGVDYFQLHNLINTTMLKYQIMSL